MITRGIRRQRPVARPDSKQRADLLDKVLRRGLPASKAPRMRTIRLELARNPGHPNGDGACGYEIRVPLDIAGRIDIAAFRRERAACSVRRFWQGENDRLGSLHHTRHGNWAFSYEPGEDDDEPLFRLESHVLRPGEYVTVHERDGEAMTFRIASVI